MKNRFTKGAGILAVASIAILSTPFYAHAVLRLAISIDGGPTVIAIDNDTTNTCASPIVGPCQLPDIDPTVGTLTVGAVTAAGGSWNHSGKAQRIPECSRSKIAAGC